MKHFPTKDRSGASGPWAGPSTSFLPGQGRMTQQVQADGAPNDQNLGSKEEEASDLGLGTCRAETASWPSLE